MSGILESLGKTTSGVLSDLGGLLDDAGIVAGKYQVLTGQLESTPEERTTGTTYTSQNALASIGMAGKVAGITTAAIAVVLLVGLAIWKVFKS